MTIQFIFRVFTLHLLQHVVMLLLLLLLKLLELGTITRSH